MATFKFVYQEHEHYSEDLTHNDTAIMFEIRNNEQPTINALIEQFESFLLATGYSALLKDKYLDLVDR